MAITRRQFVTRLGALAAAVGMSQADVSKLAEAFATNSKGWGPDNAKPKVIWLHGAECTGCSTSLLSILEDVNGTPIYGDNVTTTAAAAVTLGGVTPAVNNGGPFSLWDGAAHSMVEGNSNMNIADVVIDVVDLQYHETVMGMGGDLAAQWLNDFANYSPVAPPASPVNPGDYPFVLVVEGAIQDKANASGAWTDSSTLPWCSIGATDAGEEIDLPTTVRKLAIKPTCAAILAIGQCASYGGYPGCKPQISAATAGEFDPTKSQTGAKGVKKYLVDLVAAGDTAVENSLATAKVVNVPGCPTNPWWFVMTVVLYMASYMNGGALGIVEATAVAGTWVKAPKGSAVDKGGRLKAVYPVPVHSPYCPRYSDFTNSNFALKPGDAGCLQKIGCKGISTKSSCGIHGWNNQQLENATGNIGDAAAWGKYSKFAGHCTKAGAPCMACTEQGYPDSFVPFVKL